MSLKKLDCSVIVCDACQRRLGSQGEAEFTPHFEKDNMSEIDLWLNDAGWLKTLKGADICPQCLPHFDTLCLSCKHVLNEHELFDDGVCLISDCSCERFNWEPIERTA